MGLNHAGSSFLLLTFLWKPASISSPWPATILCVLLQSPDHRSDLSNAVHCAAVGDGITDHEGRQSSRRSDCFVSDAILVQQLLLRALRDLSQLLTCHLTDQVLDRCVGQGTISCSHCPFVFFWFQSLIPDWTPTAVRGAAGSRDKRQFGVRCQCIGRTRVAVGQNNGRLE